MPDIKWVLKSKTFWFNVLALVVLVANALGYADFQANPQLMEIGSTIIVLVNLVLRFATTQPISLGKPVSFGELKSGKKFK